MTAAVGAQQEQKKESMVPKFFAIFWGILLDAGLAIAAYVVLRVFGMSEYLSLLIATLVAGVRVAYVAIRLRELNGFGLFVMGNFAFGLGLAFVSGNPQFLLLKESFGTGFAGVMCLASIGFGRPFIFHASKRFDAATAEARAEWDQHWRDYPGFRRLFRFMTLVWGIGLLAEAAVRVPLVYTLPVDLAASVLPLLTPAAIAVLLVWTLRVASRAQQRLEAQTPRQQGEAG